MEKQHPNRMKSRCGIVELILNVQTLNKQSTFIQWQSGLGQRFKLLALNAADKFTRTVSDSTQIHQPQPKPESLFYSPPQGSKYSSKKTQIFARFKIFGVEHTKKFCFNSSFKHCLVGINFHSKKIE